jgi:hypothetical protein
MARNVNRMAANEAERGIQPTLLNASRYRPNTKSKMAAITNSAPAVMKGTDPCRREDHAQADWRRAGVKGCARQAGRASGAPR